MFKVSLILPVFFMVTAVAQTQTAQTTVQQEQQTLSQKVAEFVRADLIAAWDGEEVNIARSDIETHVSFGNRATIFARVNFLPWIAKNTIAERLKNDEDIIKGVSQAILQNLKNQIAGQFGIPAELVVVPTPLLESVLAQNLTAAVDAFVESRITPEAQRNAAIRELGFGFTLVGAKPSANQQVVFEIGKLDPMYTQDMDYEVNPTQAHMHFRFSRPAVRLKYANHSGGLISYIEWGNDAGLWELASPRGNASFEYISTILTRSQDKFFDLGNVNSWELGVIKSIGSQNFVVAIGKRPVLELSGRSEYLVGKYDARLGKFIVEASGSLERLDDPIFGETLVKRLEGALAREVKSFNVGVRAYNRYDTLVREDLSTALVGFNKGIKSFSAFTLGVGARGFMYKYHGQDILGQPYKWRRGFDAGVGITFGKKPVTPEQVLLKQNQNLNRQRLNEVRSK